MRMMTAMGMMTAMKMMNAMRMMTAMEMRKRSQVHQVKKGWSRNKEGNETGVFGSDIYSLLTGYIGSPGYKDKCGQALGIIMAP